MAVLEDLPGVEVTVQIAGKDAIEYDADDDDDGEKSLAKHPTCPTVTKYIECIDDAEFAIKVVASREYEWGYKNHALMATVYIDGNHIISRIISDPTEDILDSTKAFCQQSRQWKRYKLKFSAVSITDDSHPERLTQDLKVVKQLGLIRVDALHQNLVIPRDSPSSSAQAFSKLSPAEIERLAKERFEQIKGNKGLKSETKPIKQEFEQRRNLVEGNEIPTPTKRLAQFVDLTID
ncbi:hypothetical protein E0Z10_g3168 [Xylaria hypoxylon]|uniref:DUF7918 domain-containing protein n=1 Tax=Xylaria hypoxylon TaxID=37992 RepID=A0A4Z0Z4C3_9PEZI|nr:hypothetical protein E0Z10_g3168 [Xylaria hypoxylon]